MRHTNIALALLAAAILSACGSSDSDNTTSMKLKPLDCQAWQSRSCSSHTLQRP